MLLIVWCPSLTASCTVGPMNKLLTNFNWACLCFFTDNHWKNFIRMKFNINSLELTARYTLIFFPRQSYILIVNISENNNLYMYLSSYHYLEAFYPLRTLLTIQTSQKDNIVHKQCKYWMFVYLIQTEVVLYDTDLETGHANVYFWFRGECSCGLSLMITDSGSLEYYTVNHVCLKFGTSILLFYLFSWIALYLILKYLIHPSMANHMWHLAQINKRK